MSESVDWKPFTLLEQKDSPDGVETTLIIDGEVTTTAPCDPVIADLLWRVIGQSGREVPNE